MILRDFCSHEGAYFTFFMSISFNIQIYHQQAEQPSFHIHIRGFFLFAFKCFFVVLGCQSLIKLMLGYILYVGIYFLALLCSVRTTYTQTFVKYFYLRTLEYDKSNNSTCVLNRQFANSILNKQDSNFIFYDFTYC